MRGLPPSFVSAVAIVRKGASGVPALVSKPCSESTKKPSFALTHSGASFGSLLAHVGDCAVASVVPASTAAARGSLLEDEAQATAALATRDESKHPRAT